MYHPITLVADNGYHFSLDGFLKLCNILFAFERSKSYTS